MKHAKNAGEFIGILTQKLKSAKELWKTYLKPEK